MKEESLSDKKVCFMGKSAMYSEEDVKQAVQRLKERFEWWLQYPINYARRRGGES